MQMQRQQLGEFATIFVGMPTKQSQLKDFGPSGNVLTVRALGDFDIDPKQLVNIDFNSKDYGKYQAKTDDLIISARSTTLKMAVLPASLDGVTLNATLIAVRSLPALDPRLLAAYFNHSDGQAALEAVAQSATIQMNLTVNALRELEVPVPAIDDQKRMVGLLSATDTAFDSAVQAAQLRKRLANEVVMRQLRELPTE